MLTLFTKQYREEDLINDCLKGKAKAQDALYKTYSGKMLAVCMRYLSDRTEAEDAMINTMVKVLTRIGEFKGEGSFEGWIRRIAVNESLTIIRKRKKVFFEDCDSAIKLATDQTTDADLHAEELMEMVQLLPPGYRTVFNLYAIEGYSHKEIADILQITESTSKSQLNRARNMLKQMISDREAVVKKYNYLSR